MTVKLDSMKPNNYAMHVVINALTVFLKYNVSHAPATELISLNVFALIILMKRREVFAHLARIAA